MNGILSLFLSLLVRCRPLSTNPSPLYAILPASFFPCAQPYRVRFRPTSEYRGRAPGNPISRDHSRRDPASATHQRRRSAALGEEKGRVYVRRRRRRRSQLLFGPNVSFQEHRTSIPRYSACRHRRVTHNEAASPFAETRRGPIAYL